MQRARSLTLPLMLVACAGPGVSPPGAGGNAQTIDDAAQSSILAQGVADDGHQTCVPGQTTPEVTEGPYYKEGSPEENELVMEGMTGQRVLISGIVYDDECNPIPGAWVDIWQADEDGVYDNEGYRLRGHTFTDEAGMYTVETEVPGMYEGRTLHIHAKAAAQEGGKELTTQLFFPGVEANASDDIYREELLIDLDTSATPWRGTFHFVLEE